MFEACAKAQGNRLGIRAPKSVAVLAVLAVLSMALWGAGQAQYGYGYGNPYGYQYGYDMSGNMYGMSADYYMNAYWYALSMGYDPSAFIYWLAMGYDPAAFGAAYGAGGVMYTAPPSGFAAGGNPYGTPNMAGGTWGYQPGFPQSGLGDPMAQMDLLQQQLQAEMVRLEQELAQYDQAARAKMAEINKYFIDLYRTTTGDYTSSDEVALFYGQQIHCQQHPLDCQLAQQQAAESAAALAANNAAFQARMASQQAAFDAQNEAWRADQEARSQANTDWINTVIWGLDDYSAGAGGPTYQLPFAPSAGQTYQTPLGNPMVFDQANNIWYQISPDGSRTPYYQVP